jgi:hypothetical protein
MQIFEIHDEFSDTETVIKGFEELVAVVLAFVGIAVHFGVGWDFDSQRGIVFEIGVEFRDHGNKGFSVLLVLEIAEIFNGSLFGRQARSWAVAFDDANLSFDGAVFKSFRIFSNQDNRLGVIIA